MGPVEIGVHPLRAFAPRFIHSRIAVHRIGMTGSLAIIPVSEVQR